MEELDASLIAVPGVEARVLELCTSTNAVLLAERGTAHAVVLAAEAQSAGRGRRGRRWHSTPGRDLTFSLAVTLQRPARELAALPLVAGVAAARALRGFGVPQVALKWPNDLVVDGAKLGGILVETRSEAGGTRAVIGIGINGFRERKVAGRLRRRIACIEQFVPPKRNAILRAIVGDLMEALRTFEACGFTDLRTQWESLDAHAGQRLRIRLADGRSLSGVARGLAEDGALRLHSRGGEALIRTGRVVRTRPA